MLIDDELQAAAAAAAAQGASTPTSASVCLWLPSCSLKVPFDLVCSTIIGVGIILIPFMKDGFCHWIFLPSITFLKTSRQESPLSRLFSCFGHQVFQFLLKLLHNILSIQLLFFRGDKRLRIFPSDVSDNFCMFVGVFSEIRLQIQPRRCA